jgi:hypothetical protein
MNNKMNLLCNDLLYIIFNNLDFLSKLIFRIVSKNMHLLKIYDFLNINYKYRYKLNNKILLKYPFIKYLDASYNHKINNINHLINLEILYASGNTCGIDNDGIKNINLIELYAYNNSKITNVDHMTKLIKFEKVYPVKINLFQQDIIWNNLDFDGDESLAFLPNNFISELSSVKYKIITPKNNFNIICHE